MEELLLPVGDVHLSYASRFNRGVVVFLKEEYFMADLLACGVTQNDKHLPTCCAIQGHRVTVSGVLPFMPGEVLDQEQENENGEWLQDGYFALEGRSAEMRSVIQATMFYVT